MERLPAIYYDLANLKLFLPVYIIYHDVLI